MTLEKKIIITDDGEHNLGTFEDALKNCNYNIEFYLKPEDAINAFASSPQNYGLFIADDLYKNSDLTGTLIMQRLNAICTTMPVILINSSRFVQAEVDFLNNGSVYILNKPLNKELILASVKRFYGTSIKS